MAKKVKREIVISQQTEKDPKGIVPSKIISSTDRFLDTSTNTVAQKIGGLILAQAIYDDLGTKIDHMKQQIEALPYDDILKALITEGSLADGETPVFTVINKSGTKISKELKKSTTTRFDMTDFKAYITEKYPTSADLQKLPKEFTALALKPASAFKQMFDDKEIGPEYEEYFGYITTEKNSFVKPTGKIGD